MDKKVVEMVKLLDKLCSQNKKKFKKWRDGWIDANKAKSLH